MRVLRGIKTIKMRVLRKKSEKYREKRVITAVNPASTNFVKSAKTEHTFDIRKREIIEHIFENTLSRESNTYSV